jgi:hypothetical protein
MAAVLQKYGVPFTEAFVAMTQVCCMMGIEADSACWLLAGQRDGQHPYARASAHTRKLQQNDLAYPFSTA